MAITPKQRSARKAARTRAANRATWERWKKVDEPAYRRLQTLLNSLLPVVDTVKLRWNPLGGLQRKLKHDVRNGELIKFVNGGRRLLVLPEGYKRPQVFHPGFWERFQ